MTDRTENFDPRELAEAEHLDAQITELLHGRGGPAADPATLWLAATLRTEPGAGLRRRVAAQVAEWPEAAQQPTATAPAAAPQPEITAPDAAKPPAKTARREAATPPEHHTTHPRRSRRPGWTSTPGWTRARALPQLAAAVLALLFISHGLGNLVAGEWLSEQLGEPYAPHALTEGAWAMLAVGVAVGAGALRRRFLAVSVGAGVPFGTSLGIHGIGEITTFAYGAALHLSEGLLALALLGTWWMTRRYGMPSAKEERV